MKESEIILHLLFTPNKETAILLQLVFRCSILHAGRWRPLTRQYQQRRWEGRVGRGAELCYSTLLRAELALHLGHIVIERLPHNFAVAPHHHRDTGDGERPARGGQTRVI